MLPSTMRLHWLAEHEGERRNARSGPAGKRMSRAAAAPAPYAPVVRRRRRMRWLQAVWLVLVREGAGTVLRRALRRLWLREDYFVYVRLIDNAAARPGPSPIRVGLAGATEHAELIQTKEEFGAAQYWDLVDPDAQCYLARDGDRIVGVHWVSTREANDIVTLRAGECVIGPCVTVPRDRGRGIYPLMLSHICADWRQRGGHRAYMVVNVNNVASIRGIEKAGFRRCGRSTLIRLLGWRWVRADRETGGSL